MIAISNSEGNHTFAYTITLKAGIRKICLPHCPEIIKKLQDGDAEGAENPLWPREGDFIVEMQ